MLVLCFTFMSQTCEKENYDERLYEIWEKNTEKGKALRGYLVGLLFI